MSSTTMAPAAVMATTSTTTMKAAVESVTGTALKSSMETSASMKPARRTRSDKAVKALVAHASRDAFPP